MTNQKEREEIRARIESATEVYENPSHVDARGRELCSIVFSKAEAGREVIRFVDEDTHREDYAAFCAARNAVPRLLEDVDRLEGALKEIADKYGQTIMHHDEDYRTGSYEAYRRCAGIARAAIGEGEGPE